MTDYKCPDNEYSNSKIFSIIKKHAENDNREAFDNGILRYADRRSIAKFIAHYEIYKSVQNVPGNIVELGVFRGDSLIRFGQLSEIFNTYDRSMEVIGFDNFSGFPSFHEKDGKRDESEFKVVGGWSSSDYREDLYNIIDAFDHDRFVPQKPRIKLVEGDILETVPQYCLDNPGTKIRLLHLDADLYEPTKVALEYFWDSLSVGGVLLLDEYGFDLYPGEAAAVDEFFRERGVNPKVHKFPFTDNPGGYIIKEKF